MCGIRSSQNVILSMLPMADTKQDEDPPPQAQNDEEPMQFCPRCDSRLVPLKCKLLCQVCGYYMSCADYY